MEINLPQELRAKNTRDTKDCYKETMYRFNKINEEYKNSINTNFDELTNENMNTLFTFNEDNVFEYFTKAKNEIKKIQKNNDDILTVIKEYETIKTEIEEFLNIVNKANKIYELVSTKSQLKQIKNKLIISENILLLNENKINIENFVFDVDSKISELNNKLHDNNEILLKFKHILLKCMGEDRICYNLCNVCLTNKISICINPCGHTFCSCCIDRMNLKCGMCRGKIESKIKIFIENNDNSVSNINDESLETWQIPNSIANYAGMISNGGFGW